jgi:thiamine biosynthesis protein ThiS
MEIILNGVAESCAPSSIAELITSKGLPLPALIVLLNGASIKRDQWSSVSLKDGDSVELLNLVAGG